MKKATTTYSLKAARALEAYDVLQIRTEKTKVDHRDRDGWLDLSTLRSDADFATATRYVTTLRVDAEYRVVSMNKRDVVLSMVAHEALTVKRTREVVRSFGLTMSAKRNSAGDFRINFPNGGEATAYYSNDLDEIVGTAKAMGDELIAHNAQRDREVADLKAQQERASFNARNLVAAETAAHAENATRCVNCGELPADGHIQGCSASTKLCPGCGEMATLIPGIILTRENENEAIDYCVECWTIVEAGENGAGGVDVAGMRDVTLYARECTPLALGALTLNALDVLIGRLEAARDRATLAYAERAVEQLKALLTIVRKHRDERIARMNAQRESVEREYQAAYDAEHRMQLARTKRSEKLVEVDTIAFEATTRTFMCNCGHRVHISREAFEMVRTSPEQTDEQLAGAFDTCLRCATGSSVASRYELHAIDCPKCVPGSYRDRSTRGTCHLCRISDVERHAMRVRTIANGEIVNVDICVVCAHTLASGGSHDFADSLGLVELLPLSQLEPRKHNEVAHDDTQRVTTSRKPYSVEHVERLAYGRAESYMRPLGATQTSDEYTGAGASQVLADEYEESVSADENDDDTSENDEQKLVGGLVDVLSENRKEIEGLPSPIKYVETFDEARAHGLLTDDAGLVLVLMNGTRVFLTVQVQ
jgi:hypothetical protein